MTKITLTGAPKSTNHIYKMTCRGKFASMYMSKDGKDLKESYQWEAKSQWKRKPLKTAVILEIALYFDSKRKHDIDNYNKILLDSLTGIIWEDDNQIVELIIKKFYDKDNPRIEVEVCDTALTDY